MSICIFRVIEGNESKRCATEALLNPKGVSIKYCNMHKPLKYCRSNNCLVVANFGKQYWLII